MARMGKVAITGLKIFAYHGCTPAEKEMGQDFLIDIDLEYDFYEAIKGDDLEKAVDYAGLVCGVHDLTAGERYDLIETLAARIGEYIMETTPAEAVRVRVRKPGAPLDHEVQEVAVEMVFSRSSREAGGVHRQGR